MATKKQSGQVFTPSYLVCDILDIAGYVGMPILRKHIIDNSCGDGAFLQEIVQRYCVAFLQQSTDLQALKQELATYIHGIELDGVAYNQCIRNLDKKVSEWGVSDVKWDILHTDALAVSKFDGKMDYVVGNPPYVRVHNLVDNYQSIKQLHFTQGGMTDMYLAFYEIGFQMLRSGGKLCYITPSSWINSVAGGQLRQYIRANKNLVKLVDLEHFQPFEATTYTMIALFEKDVAHEDFTYCTYVGDKHIILVKDCLSIKETMIGNYMYLADRQTLATLRKIFASAHTQYVQVKNGFATLADSVFIRSDFPFTEYVIPVIKASTGKWYKAFYPYNRDGKPLPKEQVFSSPSIRDYLFKSKDSLLKGHTDGECPEWYLYGRTQALKDVWADKYAINSLLINQESIKLEKVPRGAGIYSGLYILTELDEDALRSILFSDEFVGFIRVLRHYKSGGYYTFSSKELEQYINYKLSTNENQRNLFSIEQ